MLPDSGSNNDLLLSVLLTPTVQRLDNLLRLHQLPSLRLGGHESEGVSLLPSLDLGEPFFSRLGDSREEGKKGTKGVVHVADDGYVGVDDFVDVLGLDLKVDDSTSTF